MNLFTVKEGKQLRCGYTTGSCAAGAVRAAATMLLTGEAVELVRLLVPSGDVLALSVEHILRTNDRVSCAICKDSGDDPDATDGIYVYATVQKSDTYVLTGGEGIGKITKPGLSCAVGEWAINPIPRQMIERALTDVAEQYGYNGQFAVQLSIPGGEEIAKKTFNPRLGVQGGLSILGTTGIVEPMSEKALIHTIHMEMDSQYAAGIRHLLAFFGNYGVSFSQAQWDLDTTKRITCSNYVGEMLDYAVYKEFSDVLLIGHIGKVVKLAQGIMNTHSRYGDGRMSFLALAALLGGATSQVGQAIYDCVTTDGALEILAKQGLLKRVMSFMCKKIEFYVQYRVQEKMPVGVIAFSQEWGVLGMTKQAKAILAVHERRKQDE